MFGKRKSFTRANSTTVKSKITRAKSRRDRDRLFLEHKFVAVELFRYYYYYYYYSNVLRSNFCFFFVFTRSGGVTAEMDPTGSVAAVDAALERLNKQRLELEQLWATRKLKLDLCLRLRIFERDALEVSNKDFVFFLYKHFQRSFE